MKFVRFHRHARLSSLLFTPLIPLATGCGGGSTPPPVAGTVKFTGSVTLDGKPLSGAVVTLLPTTATGGALGAGAVTDEGGKFDVKTGDGHSDGALPGDYRVIISHLTRPDGSTVIPSPEKSPMEIMIEEKAKESVPPKYSDVLRSTLTAKVPATGGSADFALTSK